MSAVSGSLTADGVGTAVLVQGVVSITVGRSTTGNKTSAVTVERSVDGGATYVTLWLDAIGGRSIGPDMSVTAHEPESALYRIRAAQVATGETITYRVAS